MKYLFPLFLLMSLSAFGQAPTVSMTGDVTGNNTATVVAKVNGQTFTLAGAASNQVIQFNGSAWVPVTLAAGGVTTFNTRSGAVTLTLADVNSVSATTLGTVTAGVWNGTTIAVANGGTGITSFGTGVATALGQNVTGSGSLVLSTSPTLVTPALGAATATSINGNAITTGTGTLTLGSVTLNAGAGGTLGSNAFNSTAIPSVASTTLALKGNGSGGAVSGAWIYENANYTAVAGDRVVMDNSAGQHNVTLPASPTQGDEVWIVDAVAPSFNATQSSSVVGGTQSSWSAHFLGLLANGSKLNSRTDNNSFLGAVGYLFNSAATIKCVYINSTVGWVVRSDPFTLFTNEQYGSYEPTIVVGGAGNQINNVLALENLGNGNASTITFRGNDQNEKLAIGIANPGSGAPFVSGNFIEAQPDHSKFTPGFSANNTTTVNFLSATGVYNGMMLVQATNLTNSIPANTYIVSGANGASATTTVTVNNVVPGPLGSSGNWFSQIIGPPGDTKIVQTGFVSNPNAPSYGTSASIKAWDIGGGSGGTTTQGDMHLYYGNVWFSTNGQGIYGGTNTVTPVSGIVGYYSTTNLASGSAVALTTATTTNLFSVAVAPGHYLATFHANASGSSALGFGYIAGITTNSGTLPADGSEGYSQPGLASDSVINTVQCSKYFILTNSATIYAVGQGTFTGGTASHFGYFTVEQKP